MENRKEKKNMVTMIISNLIWLAIDVCGALAIRKLIPGTAGTIAIIAYILVVGIIVRAIAEKIRKNK